VFRLMFITGLLTLLTTFPMRAQDETTWEIVQVTDIESVIEDALGDDSLRHIGVLSPDGNWISFGRDGNNNDQICAYHIDDELIRCHAISRELDNAMSHRWLPDSSGFLLHENWIVLVNEPDIWYFDVINQTLRNLTDDGAGGSIIRRDDTDEALPIDYAAVGQPGTNAIYFFRSFGDTEQTFLMRMTLDDIALTRVLEVTEMLGYLSLADTQSIDFSPDGTQLVLLSRNIFINRASVWVVDLTDEGDVVQDNPTPLFDLQMFDDDTSEATGFPSIGWEGTTPLFPAEVRWQGNERLAFFARTDITPLFSMNIFTYDLAEDRLIPAIDSDQFPTIEDFASSPYRIPPIGAVSDPTTGTLFYYLVNRDTDSIEVYTLPTDPAMESVFVGSLGEDTDSALNLRGERFWLHTLSENGRFMVGSLLVQVGEA